MEWSYVMETLGLIYLMTNIKRKYLVIHNHLNFIGCMVIIICNWFSEVAKLSLYQEKLQ